MLTQSQAASFNVDYNNRWEDFGIMWAYIIFNFAVVFFASWLYLGGLKKIRKSLSPAARKQEKEQTKQNRELEETPA
jgi:ATP-binding cassette, subfamily G (WHITE), member 2, SNQ2